MSSRKRPWQTGQVPVRRPAWSGSSLPSSGRGAAPGATSRRHTHKLGALARASAPCLPDRSLTKTVLRAIQASLELGPKRPPNHHPARNAADLRQLVAGAGAGPSGAKHGPRTQPTPDKQGNACRTQRVQTKTPLAHKEPVKQHQRPRNHPPPPAPHPLPHGVGVRARGKSRACFGRPGEYELLAAGCRPRPGPPPFLRLGATATSLLRN
jgi:hypothetical protein